MCWKNNSVLTKHRNCVKIVKNSEEFVMKTLFIDFVENYMSYYG